MSQHSVSKVKMKTILILVVKRVGVDYYCTCRKNPEAYNRNHNHNSTLKGYNDYSNHTYGKLKRNGF